MALKLDILANTRQLVGEMKKAEASVEDISDALDDLIRDGDKAGDKLEDSFRDAVREVKKLDDAARDATKGVGKSFDKAGKDVEKFGDKARDELRDSAREGAQSFSGEFTDVQDVLQETVANLGPAGIAGAAIIGAVVSTATAAVEAWNEKIDGIKEATADMWQEAAAEGQAFIDGEAIRAEAHRILWDDTYKEELETAERAGIKRSDFALALAEGEGEAFDRVHQQFMDAKDAEAEKAKDTAVNIQNAGLEGFRQETAFAGQIGKTISVLDEKAKSVEYNRQVARDAAEATRTYEEDERRQYEHTADVHRQAQDRIRSDASKPVVTRFVADTSALDRAIRNYQPPTIHIPGRIVDKFGREIY